MNPMIHEISNDDRESVLRDSTRESARESARESDFTKRAKRTKSKEQKEQETRYVERGIAYILKTFDWDPAPQMSLKALELTYAQRTAFASIKASCGLLIVPYFAIFMGTVFWVITYLFFIEAERTNKPYYLLKEEGRGWIICGCIGLGLGLLAANYLLSHIKGGFSFTQQTELFGSPSIYSVADKAEKEEDDEDSAQLIEEMEIPIDVPTLKDLFDNYFVMMDPLAMLKKEEYKELLVRSAVYYKNPLQFLLVVVCQVLFCVVIGIFSFGHGSIGSILVTVIYGAYKLVCGAGKTVSRTKNLVTMTFCCIRSVNDIFEDLPEYLFTLFDEDNYGLFMIAIGMQLWVIAQALSITNEQVVSLNFESVICSVVSLIVMITSMSMTMLAPDALTAAGTLVTFEFVGEFDNTYINTMEKFLTSDDFKNIKRRPLFHEDYLLVLAEIIFMAAAGTAVTNCIVGLSFY